MAKGDFNVEEPQYNNLNNNYNSNNTGYNGYYDNLSNMNYSSNNINYNDVNAVDNNTNNNWGNNTTVDNNMNSINTNYYNQGSYYNNADVVFEDKAYLTPEERVKDFVGGLNKKFLVFIGVVIFAILIIALIIFAIISHINASYKAKVIIPDIVYMGETENVSVVAQGRKDLDQTVTKFKAYSMEEVKTDTGKTKKIKKNTRVLNFV